MTIEFNEKEAELIKMYQAEIEAESDKTAILNAVAVALDRVDYEPTADMRGDA